MLLCSWPSRAHGKLLNSALAWSGGDFVPTLSLSPPPPPPPRAPRAGPGAFVTHGYDEPQAMRAMQLLRTIASKQWPWAMLGLSTVLLAFVLGAPSDEDDPCLIV